MPTEAQTDWVQRVLGVRVVAVGPAPMGMEDRLSFWRNSLRRWRQARDAVEQQITNLQQALQASGDPGSQQIAQRGLDGMMGGREQALAAALQGLDRVDAAALQQAARTSLPAIDAFDQHVATDRRIAACDRNPYGVVVSIRQTFVPALADLRLALKTVLAAAA